MTKTTQARLSHIALTGRVLGTWLSLSPDGAENRPLFAAMAAPGWIDEWPYGEHRELQAIAALVAAGLAQGVGESPAEAYQRLFIGPYALPAPPWGSVYLDKENVLFGESTLNLRRWLRENGITMQQSGNEPEDHIGMLLLLSAWLAEQHQDESLDILLAQHLFPWCFRFLELLEIHAGHSLYLGVAKLARLTLDAWKTSCTAEPPAPDLYF
ncbi:Tat proofreading chaperone DmsD [Sodalis ligni]|uniref:Tat proofreading chaperone DmsD n=1 Tax=Sodalis ligni TaxID=2697027 RepID=UPI00193F2682|nr:Tat proofreading chaperone DmsD [Sodalis ligni]QWA13058.1 Tat proofreading chaperone DmsD [Sodalis ligni]